MRRILLIILAFFAVAGTAAVAQTPSGLPVPRFVSLKFAEVNGRSGPSSDHPIVWTYRRQGLPVQVVAETENWRRIKDPDGEMVWMHKRTLDGRRTAIAQHPVELRAQPRSDAAARAVIEPGVVVTARGCRDEWLRVRVDDFNGWALADAFWGADCEAEHAAAESVAAGS